MIKPLLTLVGKFVPGANAIAYGYSFYQFGEFAIKFINAIKRGESNNVPIPTVKSGSLINSNNLASVAGVVSTGLSAYSCIKGNKDDRLDKYKEEMGETIERVEKGVEGVRERQINGINSLIGEIITEKAYQDIKQIIMLYLDEYIRVFPRYGDSFRNIKLLLSSNDINYQGIVRVYETLDKGPINDLNHFVDVVLYDKVCKSIGIKENETSSIEFMRTSLIKDRERISNRIKLGSNLDRERVERKYNKMNEDYMENYRDITNRVVELRDFKVNRSENYDEEEAYRLEMKYREIWENRPYKGEIPKSEFKSFKEWEDNLEQINKDLELLENMGKMDYKEKYKVLYEEYSSLCSKVRKDKEYIRVFGNTDPKEVDLSKGKLTKELVDKIVRIKEIYEKQLEYKQMEDYYNDNGDFQLIGTSDSSVKYPNPVKIVNPKDKYSALRHYNQGVSNDFLNEKRQALLGKSGTREESSKDLKEIFPHNAVSEKLVNEIVL